MSQILKSSVCFLLLLFLVSCNNEELEINSANLSQLKENLELDKFSNVNISENVEVKWEDISETQKDNFKISEIPVNEKTISTLQSNFLENQLKYQIITIESEGQLNSYFIEAYTNKGSNFYPQNITKLNNFTGTLNVYLLNGENLGSIAINSGRVRNISKNEDLDVLAKTISTFLPNLSSTSKIPACTDGYYTYMRTERTTDYYNVVTVGDRILEINYLRTTVTYENTLISYPCDVPADVVSLSHRVAVYDYKTGSGSDNGGVDAPQIFNELTGKAKCLNDLLTKNGDSFVQGILARFAGKSIFNVRIVSVDKVLSGEKNESGNYSEINGHTEPPVNKEIVIKISTEMANKNSSLDVVRTILHEYIHADLYSKTFTGLYKGKSDFETVTNMYGAQHNDMALNYLKGMKEALKKFHKTVLTDDYNKYISYYNEEPSDAFYEALAWGGLRDNKVKAWNDLPANEKTAIENLANRANMLSRMVPCNY